MVRIGYPTRRGKRHWRRRWKWILWWLWSYKWQLIWAKRQGILLKRKQGKRKAQKALSR